MSQTEPESCPDDDGSTTGYLKTVCDYVHLNPVRAGLLGAQQPMESYSWGSCGEYLKISARLRTDRLLGNGAFPRTVRPDVNAE